MTPDTLVTVEDLRQFGCTDIHEAASSYREPLVRDARATAATPAGDAEAVLLLGSVATAKLRRRAPSKPASATAFASPAQFAGRGDMSRGGLMLRCVESGEELTYVPITGTAPARKAAAEARSTTTERKAGVARILLCPR